MTDDMERETLAKLIYGAIAFHGGDPEHYEAMRGGIYHDAADAILAEFMPAHDKWVKAEGWDEGLTAGLREANAKTRGVVNNPALNPYRMES